MDFINYYLDEIFGVGGGECGRLSILQTDNLITCQSFIGWL